ncbi:MAG TPA: ATP-binding cassette domain-containing protein [Kiloniellales bacterium]|nr:ATP-binding cassette domain-containing protein [Kiloniellales bacterium]
MTALLQGEKLSMRFGGIVALREVDLAVAAGELRCIIGPNGAGKSTLFNILAGTLRPTGGHVRLEGRELNGLPVHAFARAGISRKFQVPSLFGSLTVADNLAVAEHGPGPSWTTRDELLALLGLERQASVPAAALAHGQKQWLEIGMALMAGPKVLLLDEPTAGLTAEETLKTARLLQSLAGRMAIVVIEHDMAFVRALACPTLVLHQGRVIAQGPFGEIERDHTVRDIYLGRH